MIWENGMETCILSCKKRIASLCLYRIQDAWGWCMGMIQKDDMEWEVGGGVQDWELMHTRGRFMSMYGKTNIVLQSKIKQK